MAETRDSSVSVTLLMEVILLTIHTFPMREVNDFGPLGPLGALGPRPSRLGCGVSPMMLSNDFSNPDMLYKCNDNFRDFI